MENFTKKLNNTDVERRLLLPENCLKDFPIDHHEVYYLKFKDEEGKVWRFRCRSVPAGGHSKPALSGDWFHFVRTKHLGVGDVIVIFSDKDEYQKDIAAAGEYCFRIKVKKTNSMDQQLLKT